MQNERASFWADIKDYEERLAQNPDSLLFARLADVYLKAGLIDDAIHTARKGVEKYPGYIAGQRALAMACHAKGFHDECRDALSKVTAALPEDTESQKILGRLLSSSGNRAAAISVYRTALEFNPDDLECRFELEAIDKNATPDSMEPLQDDSGSTAGGELTVDNLDADFGAFEDETDEPEDIIEDVEILELDEDDLLELEEQESIKDDDAVQGSGKHDPLYTTTLAELYLQQGFPDKALNIYHTLLANDPDNAALLLRIEDLESAKATDKAAVAANVHAEDQNSGMTSDEPASHAPIVSASGAAGDAIHILEGWLGNIGRIKECR